MVFELSFFLLKYKKPAKVKKQGISSKLAKQKNNEVIMIFLSVES